MAKRTDRDTVAKKGERLARAAEHRVISDPRQLDLFATPTAPLAVSLPPLRPLGPLESRDDKLHRACKRALHRNYHR